MTVPQPTSTRPRRLGGRYLLLIAPIALAGVGTLVGARARIQDDALAPGIRVGSLDLGGKTLEAARVALKAQAVAERETPVRLRFTADTGRERSWKTDAAHLGLGLDVAGTLDAVQKAGHDSVLGQVSRFISGPEANVITPRLTIDAHTERAYLRQLTHSVDRKAKNARLIQLKGGGFGSRHEHNGFALDIDASAAAVTQAWQQRHLSTPASATPTPSDPPSSAAHPLAAASLAAMEITLAGKTTRPDITYDDLRQIDGQIGGFATTYVTGDRGDNIHLAASHINGTLLMPGEIFSYNKIVGPRDKDAGFKQAPVIIHGQLKPGIGGGICQVSSTLYNAVLLAGLKVVQRSHHAFRVHYLPAGRDATVVDGEIDFQFQNNTPAPVYVVGSGHGGYLHFAIFGKKTPGRTVTLIQGKKTTGEITEAVETDPTLKAGVRRTLEPGHPEVRVVWYRVIQENGQVVSREPIRTHYSAIPAQVVIGTKRVIRRPRRAALPVPAARPPAPTVTPAPVVDPSGGRL